MIPASVGDPCRIKAFSAATLAPAKAIGLDREIGALAPGLAADFVLLDRDLRVKSVYIDGAQVV